MENSIHNLDTKWYENETGEFPAIVMGLNVHDPDNLDRFMDEVVEKFKAHRTCSPPETAHMSITILGYLTSDEFKEHWNKQLSEDEILKVYMSQMSLADVQHFTKSDGEFKVIDEISLIE